MKRSWVIAACVTVSLPLAFGEETLPGVQPAIPASEASPDIVELMDLPGFTNSIGMVMVKISDSFWAGKYEVKQSEYQEVMSSNPSWYPGEENPVDSVSWNEAMNFCAQLNELEGQAAMLPKGFIYTLPRQSEWEALVADASLADAITSDPWTRNGPSPVGSRGPNRLGLYDVRGNVWEWCLDPEDKPYRVARGAAWDQFIEVNLRPEFRWYANGPDDREPTIGFRCVLTRE